MKQIAISSAVIAAGLLLGGVSPSYADFKTYPASECVRWDETANGDPATYLNFSQRFNPSPAKIVRLDCPAIHDRDAGVANSWIRVIDRNPTDRICAQLVAFRHLGAAVFFKATAFKCTGIAFASPDSVQLPTGALAGPIPFDAHYYFSVQALPKRFNGADSGVVTYFVNELNGVD